MFKCNDTSCIPEKFKCNGHNECVDGSDEENCFGMFIYHILLNFLFKTSTVLPIGHMLKQCQSLGV